VSIEYQEIYMKASLNVNLKLLDKQNTDDRNCLPEKPKNCLFHTENLLRRTAKKWFGNYLIKQSLCPSKEAIRRLWFCKNAVYLYQ